MFVQGAFNWSICVSRTRTLIRVVATSIYSRSRIAHLASRKSSRDRLKLSRPIKDPAVSKQFARVSYESWVRNGAGWPFRIAWCTAAVSVPCQRKYNRQSPAGPALGSRELASNKRGLRFTLGRLYRAVSSASVFCYSSAVDVKSRRRGSMFSYSRREILEKRVASTCKWVYDSVMMNMNLIKKSTWNNSDNENQ